MKLLTLQEENILEIIKENKEYKPNKKFNICNSDHAYNDMFNYYHKLTGIKLDSSIWAWHTVDYDRVDKLVDNTIINEMKSYYDNNDQNLLLLLDVPDNLVYLTDAYAWGSYLGDTPEERKLNPYLWDIPVNLYKTSHIQAIFPTIKIEYIIDYKIL